MYEIQGISGIWKAKVLENNLFGKKRLLFKFSKISDQFIIDKVSIEDISLEAQYSQTSENEVDLEIHSDVQRCRFKGKLEIGDTFYLNGFWYQYGYVINQGYVSRLNLELHPNTPSEMQYVSDHFRLLPEEQTFFFKFSTNGKKDTYNVEIRNFDRNLSVFIPYHQMKVISDHEFILHDDHTQVHARMKIVANQSVIELNLPIFGNDFLLQLTKLDENELTYFYARLSDNYDFTHPQVDTDVFGVTNPEEVLADTQPIQNLIQKIAIEDIPNIQALLLLQHENIIIEEYFYGFNANMVHDTRSLSKSFASTLIGIMIDQHYIEDLNQPILDFNSDFTDKTLLNWDDRKKEITLKHLMTMSSGLAMNDFDEDSPGHEDKMYEQDVELNWYKYVLDLPMKYDPGTTSRYGTGGVNLLGSAIEDATQRTIEELVDEYLFGPLGIQNYYLNLSPKDDVYLGGGWHLRPRDLAKIGVMMNNDGKWQEKRILSSGWIRKALTVHTQIDGQDYCLNWWHFTISYNDKKYDVYHASGNGGQYLMLIPELQLTLVIMASNYMQFGIWSNYKNFMEDYILPSILG